VGEYTASLKMAEMTPSNNCFNEFSYLYIIDKLIDANDRNHCPFFTVKQSVMNGKKDDINHDKSTNTSTKTIQNVFRI